MRDLRLLRADRSSAPGLQGRAARSRPGHAGRLAGSELLGWSVQPWGGLWSSAHNPSPSSSLRPRGPVPQRTSLLRPDTTHISWDPPPHPRLCVPHAQALCSLRVRNELLIPEEPSAPTTCPASLSGTAHLRPFDPCLLLTWAPTCRPQLLPGSPDPSAARCGQCPALRAHASRGLPAAGPAPT